MKTIEERAEEWDANWRAGRIELQALSIHHYIHSALTELAADLNAEKEKEVAELKEKLATLAKDYSEVVAGESEMEELTSLRAWKESALKEVAELREANRKIANESFANQLALQSMCDKQLKALNRVGREAVVGVGNSTFWPQINEARNAKPDTALLDEVKRVLAIITYEESPECECDKCRFIRARRQLLTRLGGSHE